MDIAGSIIYINKKGSKVMKKLFKCSECRFVYEGEEAPDTCPKCGAPKERFSELDKQAADKVYMSDRTNDIHMEITVLAGKIKKLAEEGIKINLDPPCVQVFENAKDEAWTIKQRSKAEMEGHVGKGKW